MTDPRQWALLQAAHQFIEGGRIFENATGYAPEKAREVFVCAVVNLWLEKVGDARRIEPATAPRGFDGVVPGLPPGSPDGVEIKTRRSGSEFIFPYKFLPGTSSFWTDYPGLGLENGERPQDHFRRHQFVLLANNREIWVACGPAVMEELARELDAETRRTSFRPLDGHEPKLFLTPRPITGIRRAASRGLSALQAQYGGYAAGKSDWVETIGLPSFCSALGLPWQ